MNFHNSNCETANKRYDNTYHCIDSFREFSILYTIKSHDSCVYRTELVYSFVWEPVSMETRTFLNIEKGSRLHSKEAIYLKTHTARIHLQNIHKMYKMGKRLLDRVVD